MGNGVCKFKTGFHESLAGNDNSFRDPPARFEPIVNMPGPMRQFGHEGLETMVWIGAIKNYENCWRYTVHEKLSSFAKTGSGRSS
eukprot:COSAG06_NODE_909_length_11599_cov_61.006087_7_plen_85_part_00